MFILLYKSNYHGRCQKYLIFLIFHTICSFSCCCLNSEGGLQCWSRSCFCSRSSKCKSENKAEDKENNSGDNTSQDDTFSVSMPTCVRDQLFNVWWLGWRIHTWYCCMYWELVVYFYTWLCYHTLKACLSNFVLIYSKVNKGSWKSEHNI